MFNTEPPAGARAVPGGECQDRPGRRQEEGLGSPCVMDEGEAWVWGWTRTQGPSCACLLCSLVTQPPQACFFLCKVRTISTLQPSCFM